MRHQSVRPASSTATHLRTSQVADLLHVSPKTVSRWAKDGKLPFQRTLGGHRRYPEREIRELAATLVGEGASLDRAHQAVRRYARPRCSTATPAFRSPSPRPPTAWTSPCGRPTSSPSPAGWPPRASATASTCPPQSCAASNARACPQEVRWRDHRAIGSSPPTSGPSRTTTSTTCWSTCLASGSPRWSRSPWPARARLTRWRTLEPDRGRARNRWDVLTGEPGRRIGAVVRRTWPGSTAGRRHLVPLQQHRQHRGATRGAVLGGAAPGGCRRAPGLGDPRIGCPMPGLAASCPCPRRRRLRRSAGRAAHRAVRRSPGSGPERARPAGEAA